MTHSRRTKQDMVFQHSVPVTIKRLKIERAASLKYLDVDKLGRAASTEFDVGHVKVGRRRSAVRAVVRKGMVVALRTELCSDCEPAHMTPGLADLMKAVRRRIRAGGGRPSRPVPVAVFLNQQVPERSECHLVCTWFLCWVCCGFPSDDDSWQCSVLGRGYLSTT